MRSTASRRLPPPIRCSNEIGDLRCPSASRVSGIARARGEEETTQSPVQDLVDRLNPADEMITAGELEHDNATVSRDQSITRRVAKGPNLHIPTAGCISDVDRVREHERSGIVALSQLGSYPDLFSNAACERGSIFSIAQGRPAASLHHAPQAGQNRYSPINPQVNHPSCPAVVQASAQVEWDDWKPPATLQQWHGTSG